MEEPDGAQLRLPTCLLGTILLGTLCSIGVRLWGGSGGLLAGLLQHGLGSAAPPPSAVGWDLVQQHADCVATRGAWLDRSPVPQVLVQHLQNPAHACAADKSVAAGQSWAYERDPGLLFAYAGHPAECPLPSALDRARFCRALRGRPLLLVGDSTTFTSHDSLLGGALGCALTRWWSHLLIEECTPETMFRMALCARPLHRGPLFHLP